VPKFARKAGASLPFGQITTERRTPMDDHKWKLIQLAVRVVAAVITGIDIPV